VRGIGLAMSFKCASLLRCRVDMAMFFGSVVAVVGTALCTDAINGVPSHSRPYVMTTNAIVELGCSLLDVYRLE
jgi:hypothetical protein